MSTILYWSVIIGVAYVLWRFIERQRAHHQCLDDAVIESYRKGKLKEGQADYEHVIAHLGICEKCRDRMGQF